MLALAIIMGTGYLVRTNHYVFTTVLELLMKKAEMISRRIRHVPVASPESSTETSLAQTSAIERSVDT